MMKLYLDICVYNRPFDNQHQERIALETSAFIYILRLTSYFCLAKDFIKVDYKDLGRGRYVVALGFSAMDALHLTLAEKQNVDYFITCDDSIIKLYRKHQDIMKIKVVSLLEFISLEVK